jgi:hypothetical protein
MKKEVKSQTGQGSRPDLSSSETVSANAILSAWVAKIAAQKGVELLFELETWLRGLHSFFDIRHLPLNDAERTDMLERSFAPEIGIAHQALMHCDRCASELLQRAQKDNALSAATAAHLRRGRVEEQGIGGLLRQMSPEDSLAELTSCLNDLRTLIETLDGGGSHTLRVYLSLGRTFQRQIQFCRYVDILLSRRLSIHYDRIEDPVLANALHSIRDSNTRRNVSLALLHLFRFLKYLRFVADHKAADLPLRRTLVIFSLLHQEMGRFAEFLKLKFLRDRTIGRALRNVAGLIYYSMKSEAHRVLGRELIPVSRTNDASLIYVCIENSHGLLQNCYQSGIVTMVQAFNKDFEPKRVFASMADDLQRTQKLRQDLWDLRQHMQDALDLHLEMDASIILERLASFRETSLRNLMYKDWGEFEKLADSLMGAANSGEVRTMLRQFVGFLETLVQEVSKRSILR